MTTTLTIAPAAAVSREGIADLLLAGRNPRTFAAYRTDLIEFARWCASGNVEEALEALLAHGPAAGNRLLLAWRASMLERGLAPATINRRLSTLRALVRLARLCGLINWQLDVAGVRTESYRDCRGPGIPAVRALLRAAEDQPAAKAARDVAILRLLYDLALRRAEVVALDREDVDLEAGTIKVKGKGRSDKETLTLPASTREALARWLDARGTEPGPLFVNFDRSGKGERLTGTGLYLILRTLGARAGVKVRPHGLRHTAITQALVVTNGDVRAVQAFSRHRDLRTLLVYDDRRRDPGAAVARLVAEAA